jgi:3-oxoacyl-[acyl-carrier protein] reductase
MALFLNLEGKVSFVTGSSRGIGLAAARALAQAGSVIILNGAHNNQHLQQLAADIQAEYKIECTGLLADASDPAAVRTCYAEIFRRYGRLDVLVNNAGILRDALLGMASPELIQQVFSVNSIGAIYHLQEAARLMSRHRSGSIVNISSIVGRAGNQGQSVYAASKAAVIGLTLAASKELAPLNIRVNAVAPGFIKTDMTDALSPKHQAERLASIKMGRIGQPEDVANAVLFFASPLSTYVTGQILGVDGAMLI